jgi:hypothetical protein
MSVLIGPCNLLEGAGRRELAAERLQYRAEGGRYLNLTAGRWSLRLRGVLVGGHRQAERIASHSARQYTQSDSNIGFLEAFSGGRAHHFAL